MRQTDVDPSQTEGSTRPLPHSQNKGSQALVEETVKRRSGADGKSRIASVLPHLIQGLVLLGQMALQQEDTITACSLLEASARLAKQMGEGQDCAEPFSLLPWVVVLSRKGSGVDVLPCERPMDIGKGLDSEVSVSSGRGSTPALPSRKLRLVPALKPSVGLSARLTMREMEVLRLVADGLTDTRVAEQLVISPRTVNWHLSVIYSKLGVSSRTAATCFALEHKLV